MARTGCAGLFVGLSLVLGCSQPQPPLATTLPAQGQPAAEKYEPLREIKRSGTGPQKYALLVGCTHYPNLKEPLQLRGPGNDVVLLRKVLEERFGFPPENILTLSEAAGGQRRPTRENIRREFSWLAKQAAKGDQVVILLAGHGSQQPDQEPLDEIDGLDETFLPADVGKWDGSKQVITNAIRDDELKEWTSAITSKGAALWVIVDACHSGTALRGEDEVMRGVPVQDLVPREVLSKIQEQGASERPTTGEPPTAYQWTNEAPNLVALYAAQSTEPTVERKPYDGSSDQPYGLLTYTLCQILTQTQTPLTYRELVQRIHARYIHWERFHGPTPAVEGKEIDREVLGTKTWPDRSRFLLKSDKELGLVITGGQLHGLTEGSILAVHPAAGGARTAQPLGHVRVVTSDTLLAQVNPCAYGKSPVVEKLPEGSRCEPVYIDYGTLRLKLAPDSATTDNNDLQKSIKALTGKNGSLIELVNTAAKADWLLQLQQGKLVLVSARLPAAQAQRFGPLEPDDAQGLETTLARIARTRNLLKLATSSAEEVARGGGENGLNVEVELIKYRNKLDRQGTLVRWQTAGLRLTPGEYIAFRVTNRSRYQTDITLLFVDSGHGIQAAFPYPGTTEDNRLKPGQSIQTLRARVNSRTTGLEHMVVLAVRGQGPQVDFGCLGQPTLDRARGAVTRGNDRQVLDSPLGQLLQNAMYANGSTRGLTPAEVDGHVMRLLSWRVGAEKAENAEPR